MLPIDLAVSFGPLTIPSFDELTKCHDLCGRGKTVVRVPTMEDITQYATGTLTCLRWRKELDRTQCLSLIASPSHEI